MLKGEQIRMRPIGTDDLDQLYAWIIDIESRGDRYPMPQTSFVRFRRAFDEHGFWTADSGIFLIVAPDDRVVGQVDWSRLVGDVPDMALGYRVFSGSDRGKGYVSDAVRTMTRWLFETQPINRIRLTIHVENAAAIRVAERCGFTFEATCRAGWPNRGEWHDVNIYTLTRAEFVAEGGHKQS